MRYSLRTLLIVMLLGGPALAGAWWGWLAWCSLERQTQGRIGAVIVPIAIPIIVLFATLVVVRKLHL